MADEAKRKRGSSSSSNSSISNTHLPKKKAIEDSEVFCIEEENRDNIMSSPAKSETNGAQSAAQPQSLPPPDTGHRSEAEIKEIQEKHKIAIELLNEHPETHGSIEAILSRQNLIFETTVENVFDRKIGEREKTSIPKMCQEVYESVKHDMEEENEELKNRLSNLEGEFIQMRDTLNNQLFLTQKKVVENENYMRKYNMKIYGLKENPREDLKRILIWIIYDKLNIHLQEYDIEVIHRMGKPTKDKIRPVICRFHDRGVKYAVMMQRKSLKNTGIAFDEDLSNESIAIMKELKAHEKVKNVWSWNGKIMAIDITGKKHTIWYGEDWVKFFDKIEIKDPNELSNNSSGASDMQTSPAPATPSGPTSVISNASTAPGASASTTAAGDAAQTTVASSASQLNSNIVLPNADQTPSSLNQVPVCAAFTSTTATSTNSSSTVTHTSTSTTVSTCTAATILTGSGSTPAVSAQLSLNASQASNSCAALHAAPPVLPSMSLATVNMHAPSTPTNPFIPDIGRSVQHPPQGFSTPGMMRNIAPPAPPVQPHGFSFEDTRNRVRPKLPLSAPHTPTGSSTSQAHSLPSKSLGLLSPNPPKPTRFVGSPQFTQSPRATGSPLFRGRRPRTPAQNKNHTASPCISNYFGGKPAG